MINSKLKKEFRQSMIEYLKKLYYYELGFSDWKQWAEWRINGTRGRDISYGLEKQIKAKNKKILDVGSGLGEFVVFANLYGAEAFGVEPNEERVKNSRLRAKIYGEPNTFCVGVGENLPIKDCTFDIVTCISVLEHTQEPTKVVNEMVRVLKNRGYCYVTAPNYFCPYLPHYKIFWFPLLLPKGLTKKYLMLRGRKPDFLEHINFTTHRWVLKLFKGLNVRIKDLKREEIREKADNVSIADSKVSIDRIIGLKIRQSLTKVTKFLHWSSFFLKIIELTMYDICYLVQKINRDKTS